MNLKKILKKEESQVEKWKIVVWTIWWLWFLICSVLIINIFQNPVLKNKKISNTEKNSLVQHEVKAKNFHWSAERFFSSKEKIWKNVYLINLVEKISDFYEKRWKISYNNPQEKELFLRKIAKKYTLKNIDAFRRASTAEKNVEKFSWRLLNKTLPVWFEINMDKLEWIFVGNIK